MKNTVYISTLSLLLSVVSVLVPASASALDASFIPQATATLTCLEEGKTDKKITRFDNNAPAGSKVVLVEGRSEGGGITFGKEVNIGDVVVNTPQLFWRIDGELLGPWEVPTTVEGRCLTNESAYANDSRKSTDIVPYVLGAGGVMLLLGAFWAGLKFARK